MEQLVYFFGSLMFFLALGIPISLVLVLCSIVLMYAGGAWDVMTIPNIMVDGANNFPLMAIPFFVFAGEIMAAGGLSKRVVQLAQLLIGRVKGGLGYAAILASVIFAGLMGSSVGEAAALGGLLLPMMTQVARVALLLPALFSGPSSRRVPTLLFSVPRSAFPLPSCS